MVKQTFFVLLYEPGQVLNINTITSRATMYFSSSTRSFIKYKQENSVL